MAAALAQGTFELVNGVHVFHGFLNENVVLSELIAPDGEPLTLDLGGVKAINSIGIRSFSQMMRANGRREISILRAPVCFVEAVNTVPSLVGGAQNGRRIRSLFVPYMTQTTGRIVDVLVQASDVRLTPRGAVLPPALCPETGAPMATAVVLDDYLIFLLYAR